MPEAEHPVGLDALGGTLPEATKARSLADELAAIPRESRLGGTLSPNRSMETAPVPDEPEGKVAAEIEPTGLINVGDRVRRRDEGNALYGVEWIKPSQSGRRIDVRLERIDTDGKGITLWEKDLLEKLADWHGAWSRA